MAEPFTRYFKIRIDSTGLIGPAPADGFIDHMSIEEHARVTSYPTTADAGAAKARANARYLRMLWFLQDNNIINDIRNINNGGADHDNPGTFFEFVVGFEYPEIFTENELYGTGHPSGGIKVLQNEDAIKRKCARIWLNDWETQFKWKYVPHSPPNGYEWIKDGLIVGTPLSGTLEAKITAAESSITVTPVADM